MKRIFLFLATNLAIMVVLGIVLQLIGVDSLLDEQGVDLNLEALLIFSAVFGMGGSFISLAISKWTAKRMMGAQVISEPKNQSEQWLVQRVSHHAQAAGIGMPEVAIFESPDPNAFATGARRDNALVAVSTGLLAGMRENEADAVIAHEISHIANGDMVTLTLIQGVVNTFVIFFSRVIGHAVDRIVFKTERGHGPAYYVTSIVAQILLTVAASALVMSFSRKREFRADEGGAKLAGTTNMIAALKRLQGDVDPVGLPEQMQAFGISGGKRGLAQWFSSHPSLDDRIAALEARGG